MTIRRNNKFVRLAVWSTLFYTSLHYMKLVHASDNHATYHNLRKHQNTKMLGTEVVHHYYQQDQQHEYNRVLSVDEQSKRRTFVDTFNSGVRPRIIGGTNTQPSRYPYMVYLANREDDLSCGGTLISPTVVMTSAHCET
jgi:hypothetical protein